MFISRATIKDNVLITFDEFDNVIDIIDFSYTKVGTVYKASVEKVLRDIEGCILKIPEISDKGFIENKYLDGDKFLVRHSNNKLVCQADEFYVRICKDKKSTKPYSCSFVECIDDQRNNSIDYIYNLLGLSADIMFDDKFDTLNVYSIIEKAVSKHVYLKNDADIVIESTTAMNVVDVNTGKGFKKKDKFETNKLALLEIARQIRLRNLSGIIVIDLLKDMNKSQQAELIDIFKQAVSTDYASVNVFGFTSLGLLEVTRERIFSPLYEIFEKYYSN